MIAQKGSPMNTQPNNQPLPPDADPIDQARELLARLSNGFPITTGGPERDAAVVAVSAQIATAAHVKRVGDLLESLVDYLQIQILMSDLGELAAKGLIEIIDQRQAEG